jgi:phosphate transport system substrate-binding protein
MQKALSLNKVSFLLLMVLAFALPASAAELDHFTGLSGTIDIAGGTAHIPVMNDAARAIMTFNDKINITVAGGGSGVGVQKVGEGLVDIGNAGRALSDKEKSKYPTLKSFPFAIDGVAPVVHPENPVTNLNTDQLRDIFAGKIVNWKEVGGHDSMINLYSRDEASGTRAVFWSKALNKESVADNANIVPSNGAMKVAISRDPNALGYVSIGHIDNTIKALSLDGVIANQTNALNGTYPVIRKLYMNTNGTPTPLVQAFIDYLLGNEGATFVSQHGYLPVN